MYIKKNRREEKKMVIESYTVNKAQRIILTKKQKREKDTGVSE